MQKQLPGKKPSIRRARGFTLIELIAVTILVGILVSVAIPRFFNLKDNAGALAMQSLAGGFSAGLAVGKAQWIADGNSASSVSNVSNQVYIDGVDVNVNRFGWLDSVNESGNPDLSVTNQSAKDCQEVFEFIFHSPPSSTIKTDVESRRQAQYAVSVIKGAISDRCRYELIVRADDRPEDAQFYFDYELLTGRVTVGRPGRL